jgi:DNA-binding GntR family transcriptional regulator
MTSSVLALVKSDDVGSAAERAYRLIRRAILDLTFAPGSALSEAALVDQIGVSRTPVRQALQRLEHDQLVKVFPQRGTIVAPLDMAGFREALFTRVSLEVSVAAQAAHSVTAAQCEELGHEVREQQKVVEAGDDEAFFRLNEIFHRRVMALAGVPNVWTVVESVKVHLDRFRAGHLALTEPYPLEPVVKEHEALVEAFARGDKATAAALMREHVEKIAPRAQLLFERRPEFFSWPPGVVGPVRLRSIPER